MIDVLCKSIIKQLSINRIVETGTDKGETIAETSRWFAEFYPEFGQVIREEKSPSRSYSLNSEPIAYPVFSATSSSNYQIYSVDIDEHSYQVAQERFKTNNNIHLVCASSELFLKSLLKQEAQEHHNYLFFLDAHWGKYWPLRDEIKVIRKLEKYVIVIDDFFVPGKSNPAFPHGAFGFDLYQNRILSWGYLCDLFERTQVRVYYPKEPNRDQRGWVVLFHGFGDDELKFMDSLALFEMDPADKTHSAPVKPVWRSHWDVKNILKEIVPIHLLRQLHRFYERVTS